MTQKPNILLFTTDDHGAWALGSSGNSEVQSPVLDSLSAGGVRFSNAFTPSPVCSPARACLLTGRTPSQVGIHDWLEESIPQIADHDWLAREITLPELLKTSGYYCGLSGKWHLGQSHYTPRGFDWCFGLPRGQGSHNETYTYHQDGRSITLSGNKTAILTDRAIDFIERAPADRPFFLNVGYIATHSPYADQDPALVDLYRNATFADIPAYEPHPWRKNEYFTSALDFDPRQRRDACANYYAAVTEIDRNVGRLLTALDDAGRGKDTIVIYLSDHGVTLGHHGFWGKGNSTRPLNMYDTSLRIPMIWRGPGISGGTTVDLNVDHYDTFITLCELAGVTVDPHRHYPGCSYRRSLVDEPQSDWRESRFGEYGDLRMIRTPLWKFVSRFPKGPNDLFELTRDPGETNNLAGEDRFRSIEQSLQLEIDTFYSKHEDVARSGLAVKSLPRHNGNSEAWRDGIRESRGLQAY